MFKLLEEIWIISRQIEGIIRLLSFEQRELA